MSTAYSYIVSSDVKTLATGADFTYDGVLYKVGTTAFSDIVYAETQFVVDKLNDPALTEATIGVAASATAYGSATDPINNFAGVTLSFLDGADTTINATTFKNEEDGIINAGTNITFSATIENSGELNLNGTTFKPTTAVLNDGTINIAEEADVVAQFSGDGTINLLDNEIEGLTIYRAEVAGNNTVIFAGSAAMQLTNTTIKAGTVKVDTQNVKLQSGNTIDAANLSFEHESTKYIYVEGANNTINAPISTEGKFIVLRNGGELVNSTVLGAKVKMDDGNYFKNAAQAAAISGTGEYTSIIVRTSSQATADVVNELTIQNTGNTDDDFVFVRKDLYVGLNNQTGKLVLDNAKVAVVDPNANVDAVFTVRGPTGVGSTAELKNGSLLSVEDAIIYYGCTVNVELGSTFLADSIGIAPATTAGGTINIVVDSDDLVKTERYTLVDADSINALIALKVSLDEDDAVAIVDGAKLVTVDDVDYFITTLDHSGVYVTSDSQATLYVNSDWSTYAKGEFLEEGYLVGYNAFGTLAEALKAATAATTTISIASAEVNTEAAGNLEPVSALTLQSADGEAKAVEIKFADGDHGLFLKAGSSIGANVTLTTTAANNAEMCGTVYLNYAADSLAPITVTGNIDSASDIYILGPATISGDLTVADVDGQLLLRSGKSNVAPATGAEQVNQTVTISGTVTGQWVELISGEAVFSGANVDVEFLAYDSYNVKKGDPLTPVYTPYEYVLAPTLTSTGSTWTIDKIDLGSATTPGQYGAKPVPAVFSFDESEVVTGDAELGSFITMNVSGKITDEDNAVVANLTAANITNNGTLNVTDEATVATTGYINNRQTGKIKVTDGASVTVNGAYSQGRSIINFASATSKGTITIGSAAVPAVGEVGDDDYVAPVAATKGFLTVAETVANAGGVIETYGGSELEIGTTLQNYSNGTVSINDTYLHASKVTNAEGCTFTVGGASTLKIGTLEGTIKLLNDATITATITTGGSLSIENAADNVKFAGSNVFSNTFINNAGTITINAGASISAKSIAGGSIELVADDTVLATAATLYVTADLSTSHNTGITVNGVAAFADAAARDAFYSADNANIAVAAAEGKKAYTILKEGNTYSLIQTPTQETLYVGTADDLADNPAYVLGYNAFTSFKEALLKAVEVGSATVSVVSEDYAETYEGNFAPTFKSNLTINGESVSLTNTPAPGKTTAELCLGTNPASAIVINNSIATTGNIVVSWQAWVEEGPRPKTDTTINANITAAGMIQFGSDTTVAQTATLNGGNVQFSGPYASDLSYNVSITGTGDYEAADDPQVQAGTLTFVDGNVTVTDSKVNSTGKILFTDDGESRTRALSANLVSTRTTWNVNELKVAYYAGSIGDEPTREVTLAEGAGVFTFTNSVLNITGALDNVARKRIGYGSDISDAAIAGAPALTISAIGGSTIAVGGTVTNSGTINVGNAAVEDDLDTTDVDETVAASKGTLTAGTIENSGTISAYSGSSITVTSTGPQFVLKNAKGATINAYGSTIQVSEGLQNWGTMLVSGANAALSINGSLYNGNNEETQGKYAVLTVENGASVTGAVFNYRTMNLTNAQVGPATGTGRVFNNNGTLNAVNTNFNVGALNNKNWFNFNQDSTATYTAKNTINATAIDNTVSFKVAYADITAETVTNSGTFEATNSTINAANVTNNGTFTMIDGSVSGSSVSTADADDKFVVSGTATLNIGALTGRINVLDGAALTAAISPANEAVGAVQFNAATGTTTAGITIADGSAITAIINNYNANLQAAGALTAGAIWNKSDDAKITVKGALTAGAITNQGTIVIDANGSISAASVNGGLVTINAAGAVASTDPIALTVGEAGITAATIDLTVSAETLAGSTASYQFVNGTVGLTGDNAVTLKVNGTTYVENQVIGESNYILTTKGGTGLWMVQKASTQVLSVSSAYTPATDGWNISNFASLVLALKGVQFDTVSLVVEEEYAPETPETLTDDLTVTFVENAAISGKAFTLAGDEDDNKENLILRAADGKTLTIGNNITLNNANIVLNNGKQSTAIVSGNLKGNEVQIDGNATVTGTLTADTLLWLRNGKSVATPGAEGNAITLSKAVSAETVLISSGKVAMTTADADVSGTSLIIGPVDDTTAAVSIVSDGADWTFTSNMLATGTNADSFTLNGGSLSFAGGESSIKIGTRTVDDDTALIENANFTLTLNNGAKLNAKTIDNIGKIIMVDGSATEINATAIVNRASAEVPTSAQKAIINAKNITAGSIENYGTIGNLEVENQKIAKLDVGTLTNKQYGGVFATALEADSIENSGEIVVTTLTITSADGLIDNKAGGKIAQDNEAMTIVAKAIDNVGYISTHGGAITATAITNGAYVAATNDGVIAAGNVTATGTISNDGKFVATGNVSADRIDGNGTFTIDGTTTVSGNIVIGNEATFNGDIQTANINAVNASSKINLNGVKLVSTGVVRAIGTITATGATLDGNTLDYQNGRFIIKGASSLKNVNLTSTIALPEGVVPAVELEGVTLDSSASITGGIATVTADSTFNGVNSFGSLAVAEGKKLSIVDTNVDAEEGEIVGPCLTITGDFTNAGLISIDVSAFDAYLEEGKAAQVISVLGDITNTGDFEAYSLNEEGGLYQVIVQNEYEGDDAPKNGIYVLRVHEPVPVKEICVNQAWKDNMEPGETFEFAGVDCVYGLNAFQNTNEILNLTDYTDTIVFAGGTEKPYKKLTLNTGSDILLDVVKSTGTGISGVAFEGVTIANKTQVEVNATSADFGVLNVSDGSKLSFDPLTIQTVSATRATIDGSFVDFDGVVTIGIDSDGGDSSTIGTDVLTITNSRSNIDEADVQTGKITVYGNVVITDSDVDFDGSTTEINGNVTITSSNPEAGLFSEVEFDQTTNIYGKLTLGAGSVIEADQGFSFTTQGAEINGILDVDTEKTGNTIATLGDITGNGTIYTDIYSQLDFRSTAFKGTVMIDVTGLEANSGVVLAVKKITGTESAFTAEVYGDHVAEGTLYQKYFTYNKNTGLTQIARAANVYEATVASQSDINAAVTGTGWNASGTADNPTYFVDNVTLTANGTFTAGQAIYLGVNDDQNVILNGKYNVGVYGGKEYTEGTTRVGINLGGDITVTVNSGSTFDKVLVGGDRINVSVDKGRNVYFRENADGELAGISLTINGGTFKNYVATGILYQGENLQGSVEVGSTNLTINGGSFAKDVYGGNYGNKKSSSSCTFVESSNVTLTVGGAEKINMAGCLFVGSFGSGKVQTTKLTLAGQATDSDALVVKEIWGGCGSDYNKDDGKGGTTYETAVSGSRTLSFTGFQAAINSRLVSGFSDVEVLSNGEELLDEDRFDTNATLQDTVKLSNVENWTFEAGSTLNGAFINDFAGDSLTLFGIGDYFEATGLDSWTLFDDTTNFAGFDSFKDNSVKFDGDIATFTDGAWVAGDYKLSIDENNAMVLSRPQLA